MDTGAWQQIERGEVELNDTWFARFKQQLENPGAWRDFCAKKGIAAGAPVPNIDAKALFWEMMRISREPDPYMYPALLKLATFTTTTAEKGRVPQFVLAALSNTIAFPPLITDETGTPFTSSLIHPPSSSSSSSLKDPKHPTIAPYFDLYLSSAHLGVRKPSPEAYALAIREISAASEARGTGPIKAEEVVFLDDIGANLKGAKAVGLRTIKVNLGRTKEAVQELEAVVGRKLLENEDGSRAEAKAGKSKL